MLVMQCTLFALSLVSMHQLSALPISPSAVEPTSSNTVAEAPLDDPSTMLSKRGFFQALRPKTTAQKQAAARVNVLGGVGVKAKHLANLDDYHFARLPQEHISKLSPRETAKFSHHLLKKSWKHSADRNRAMDGLAGQNYDKVHWANDHAGAEEIARKSNTNRMNKDDAMTAQNHLNHLGHLGKLTRDRLDEHIGNHFQEQVEKKKPLNKNKLAWLGRARARTEEVEGIVNIKESSVRLGRGGQPAPNKGESMTASAIGSPSSTPSPITMSKKWLALKPANGGSHKWTSSQTGGSSRGGSVYAESRGGESPPWSGSESGRSSAMGSVASGSLKWEPIRSKRTIRSANSIDKRWVSPQQSTLQVQNLGGSGKGHKASSSQGSISSSFSARSPIKPSARPSDRW